MSEKFDLLSTVEYGGCSAKIPAAILDSVLLNLPRITDANVLVDIDTHDDAGVYRINDELALIFTTDFFPPICSDPFEFGQIAATNSFSDVYAMGGEPFLALNLAMFPSSQIPLDAYKQILEGAADVAQKANAIIIGGHTIDDYPPKFGLAVIGRIKPDRVITNAGLKPGQKLILTKPIGTGVIVAGQRIGMVSESAYRAALDNMKVLNDKAALVMQQFGVTGATDVTGFGLLGHLAKMLKASGVGVSIDTTCISFLPEAYQLTDEGCIPGAAFRNLEFIENVLEAQDGVDYNTKMLMCDAQTSGGILMGVNPEHVNDALEALKKFGYLQSTVIGEVTNSNKLLLIR
ncbi:selenide, water dikinase SelD [Tenuifilum thalassicum]|uniref:Selenide, water dikinase n=1 Tax=Tenuifilum thalassicum TaxID=2590900 RepID=A0A7D3XKT3_9BACT|nr:selenide, water dikinase SelD [Tenuifilum thalassicum]QKG79990.1 selenide, water dikinase SelD [Tenuifilum thalassicum]